MKTIKQIIRESIENFIQEDGGGATTCASVMQGGGDNPSAGQYDVPFLGDKQTKKRSKDFSNGSMMMQRLKEDWEKANEINNCQYRPIYQPKVNKKK